MNTPPFLDTKCGDHFYYRDFVECGETFDALRPKNTPKELKTYESIRKLNHFILDPVWKEFGTIKLTYGISSQNLYKNITQNIAPNLDQHAAWEKNIKGKQICARGGAAVDFLCLNKNSLLVAQWIVKNCEYDRLYFYGSDRPVHISVGPGESRQVVLMRRSKITGRRVPRKISNEDFVALLEHDPLVKSCSSMNEDASDR